jgi:MFS transporter, PPP family, 3-phenylpropionic acid transporter
VLRPSLSNGVESPTAQSVRKAAAPLGKLEEKPVTPSPELPTESRGRTVLYLSALSFALFLPVGLHLPYFPVWLAARDFSHTEIAAALAIPMVLRVAATPLVAAIADKRGIGATLAVCAITLLAGYCSLGYVRGFAAVFAGAVLVATGLGLMPPLADALTLAGIRRVEDSGLGRIAYGGIRVWTSAGVFGTMLSSGFIVGVFPGERIIFALVGLTFLPALAALLAAVKLKNLHVRGLPRGGLTEDRERLRLALAFIAAAALIQASHAEVYSFASLHWRAAGYADKFIGAAWAIGVTSESILFLLTARYFGAEKNAAIFLALGATGAVFRWLAMSTDPGPLWLIPLQAMHGLSFGATYFGSVLLLGSIARETHRARMQGWLAAASGLSLALATFACGRLTSFYGERAYLAMAGLALVGLVLAAYAAALKRRIEDAANHPQRSGAAG